MNAWSRLKNEIGANGVRAVRGDEADVVVRLQESRQFMARTFEEGARADAAAIASLERKADRLASLFAAAPKHAA